jgi:hypothetical protein
LAGSPVFVCESDQFGVGVGQGVDESVGAGMQQALAASRDQFQCAIGGLARKCRQQRRRVMGREALCLKDTPTAGLDALIVR